jgi:serine/threonine protein kinase
MPQDLQRARELFLHAVGQLPPEQWDAYLAEACGSDEDLHRQAAHLLQIHREAGSFLERPAAGAIDDDAGAVQRTARQVLDPPPGSGTIDEPADGSGAVIAGRYKLLQQIGEGGMGTVWMAEQFEPIKRRVAVKLIRVERGQSKTIMSRFEAERQAIALMDHPHIARLLDAGEAPPALAGGAPRPFFVMELVKGLPLTDYCDAHKLGIPERLRLFMQVCTAVQHAHQKGVIHRDLKPSNILVESHDGKPVPKIIDFGLAKATTGLQLSEHTLFTAFGTVMGTPLYMAPEQASVSALDVDTRADVYALGIILYELLTGTTPITRAALKKAALDEMLKLIREQEVPTPSSRLSSADSAPSVAANRQTEPVKLGRLVKGELDWIVLKALAKERDRRYETANGFARDVERFLNHEPVTAGPPSAGYRFRKFARRNRAALATASIVAAAVVVGAGVATWQAVRATRAEGLAAERLTAEVAAGELAKANEARAVTEARRATAVADLLQRMLESANPESAQKAGMTVRELLDAFAAGLGERLKDQPEVEASMRQVIGRAYWRLNLNAEAAPHLERAVALRRETPGTDPRMLAESLAAWGRVLYELRDERAKARLEEALAVYRQAGSPPRQVIEVMVSLVMLVQTEKRVGEAARLVAEARELARALPGGDDPGLACMLHVRALNRRLSGQPVEAEALARESVGMHRRTRTSNDVELAHGLTEWAYCLHALKRDDEAEPHAKEALAIFRVHFPDDQNFVVRTLNVLLSVLRARGKAAEADEIAADHTRRLEARPARDPKGWLSTAEALRSAEQWEPALRAYREAARLAGPDDRPARGAIGKGLWSVGTWMRVQGKRNEAVPVFQEAAALLEQVLSEAPAGAGAAEVKKDLASALSYLGWTLTELSRNPEAVEPFRKALPLWAELRATDPKREFFHHEHAFFTTLLAGSLRASGRLDEAEAAGREGVRLHEELLARSPADANHRRRLGDATRSFTATLEALGRRAEAIRLLERVRAVAVEWPDGAVAVEQGFRLVALYRADGRPADALPVLDDMQRRVTTEETNRNLRTAIHRERALTCTDLGRHDAAAEEWGAAAGLSNGNPQLNNRARRAISLVRAGRMEEGISEAEDLARLNDSVALILSAHVHTVAADRSNPPDAAAFDRHAGRAIELLRQAAAKGWKNTRYIVGDDNLDALRDREDFRAVLAEMGKGTPAGTYSGALAILGDKLLDRRKYDAAEAVLRDCLAVREKEAPDDWTMFNTLSMLGKALLGQDKYVDAEPLLLKGYEGMKAREKAIPQAGGGDRRIPESLDRLIELYTATDKPDEAAKWRTERAKYPAARPKEPK